MAKKQAITKDVRDAIGGLVYRITLEEIEEIRGSIDDLIMPLIERRDLSLALLEVLRSRFSAQDGLYRKAVSIANRLKRVCELLDGLDSELNELHKKWRKFDDEFDK